MSQTLILDEVRMWLRDAFKQHLGTERASWETVFQVQQNEQGQVLPYVILYTQINAAKIGDFHMNVVQLATLGLTPEVVNRGVQQVLEALWKARSDALLQPNGHKETPGQIILPGRG